MLRQVLVGPIDEEAVVRLIPPKQQRDNVKQRQPLTKQQQPNIEDEASATGVTTRATRAGISIRSATMQTAAATPAQTIERLFAKSADGWPVSF